MVVGAHRIGLVVIGGAVIAYRRIGPGAVYLRHILTRGPAARAAYCSTVTIGCHQKRYPARKHSYVILK